ncbi:MAG: hypothetical protein AABX89_05730 [Candidatus Thermoplasmatota archaeon]
MRNAGRVALALLPFAALAPVLRLVPNAATAFQPMPWSHAAGHALVLAGLMAAHAACYARWSVGAPRLIAQNEAFTRLWFVTFGFLVVAGHKPTGGLYLALALPWAALSFLAHRRFALRDGGYRFTTNFGLLGFFLLGLALIGLIGVRAVP